MNEVVEQVQSPAMVATDTKKSVAFSKLGSYLLLRGWLQQIRNGAAEKERLSVK